MSPKQIQIGHTYVNRGKGTTRRKVLEKILHVTSDVWWVLYEQDGREQELSLASFAKWAGRELLIPDDSK